MFQLLVAGFSGYYNVSEPFINSKQDSSQVAANETVDVKDAQTIMIIQDGETFTEDKESFLRPTSQVCGRRYTYRMCLLQSIGRFSMVKEYFYNSKCLSVYGWFNADGI